MILVTPSTLSRSEALLDFWNKRFMVYHDLLSSDIDLESFYVDFDFRIMLSIVLIWPVWSGRTVHWVLGSPKFRPVRKHQVSTLWSWVLLYLFAKNVNPSSESSRTSVSLWLSSLLYNFLLKREIQNYNVIIMIFFVYLPKKDLVFIEMSKKHLFILFLFCWEFLHLDRRSQTHYQISFAHRLSSFR